MKAINRHYAASALAVLLAVGAIGYAVQVRSEDTAAPAAQSVTARHEARFTQLDADGDGIVTRAEAEKGAPGMARRFERFDTDKDGAIGKDEWSRGHQAMMEQYRARREQCRQDPQECRARMQERAQARFSQADLNGDGALSRDEAEKGVPGIAHRFYRLDANQDGQVTPDELQAARKARHERRMDQRQERRSSLQM